PPTSTATRVRLLTEATTTRAPTVRDQVTISLRAHHPGTTHEPPTQSLRPRARYPPGPGRRCGARVCVHGLGPTQPRPLRQLDRRSAVRRAPPGPPVLHDPLLRRGR